MATEPALSEQKLHLWILVIWDQKARIPLGKAGQKFWTLWGIPVTVGMLLALWSKHTSITGQHLQFPRHLQGALNVVGDVSTAGYLRSRRPLWFLAFSLFVLWLFPFFHEFSSIIFVLNYFLCEVYFQPFMISPFWRWMGPGIYCFNECYVSMKLVIVRNRWDIFTWAMTYTKVFPLPDYSLFHYSFFHYCTGHRTSIFYRFFAAELCSGCDCDGNWCQQFKQFWNDASLQKYLEKFVFSLQQHFQIINIKPKNPCLRSFTLFS